MKISIIGVVFIFLTNIHFAYATSQQVKLTNKIQQLLNVDSENLTAEEVKPSINKVLNNRQHFSNDIVAKVYLLSARVAANEGNVNNVLKFAEKGLVANSLDKNVRLALLFKLADVYIIQKKYKKLLEVSDEAVTYSKLSHHLVYQLLSLSYRSVAFAMHGQHQRALTDLRRVEQEIKNTALTDHINLLTILALAYNYLSDYQTLLSMQLKILKLKFEVGKTRTIAQTYLYLGYAYLHLRRFDDAYNAFWEAKNSAHDNHYPIYVAHANQFLGIVLIGQQKFNSALKPLQQSIKVFTQFNMKTEQIEASIALARAKIGINEISEAHALLTHIITLLKGKGVNNNYTGFYRMVAEMYFTQENYKLAYRWREKYSQILLEKLTYKGRSLNILKELPALPVSSKKETNSSEESKDIVVKLAEKSTLSSVFSGKYQKQRLIIFSLLVVMSVLLMVLVGVFFRLRVKKFSIAYEEIDKPTYIMPAPMKTKAQYQLVFKKSREFKYALTVGYLVIDNWEELTFHFNRKSIKVLQKELAIAINEQITEFDFAGILSDGEYIVLFEHQDQKEVQIILEKLVQTINARAFGHLGRFSVMMKYSLNTVNFKDIDPYLFLARISEELDNNKRECEKKFENESSLINE